MKFKKNTFTLFALASAAITLSACNNTAPAQSDATIAEPKTAPVVTTEKASPAATTNYTATKTQFTPAPVKSSLSKEEAENQIKAIREEIEKIQLEKSTIDARLALMAAEREAELLPLNLEKQEIEANRAAAATALAERIAKLDKERSDIERELAIANTRLNLQLQEKQFEAAKLEAQIREVQLELAAVHAQYTNPMDILAKKSEISTIATQAQPKYLKEPFVDGTLYVSDRRIDFNGPVTAESAARAINQIHFFNNKSTEYPIFIVITNSPGGSVSAGYQIQKAMQSSKAPVYVLVKGMAASMAAVIATTAERSFCFENTMMLHHQISTAFPQSNLTILKESVAQSEKWYQIFAAPVAKKMGITVDEFTKLMYEHNSKGDWVEYGENAVKWKWIDHVVTKVEETAMTSLKQAARPTMSMGISFEKEDELVEKVDSNGKHYVELPPLSNPLDCWWIHNENGYYRTR